MENPEPTIQTAPESPAPVRSAVRWPWILAGIFLAVILTAGVVGAMVGRQLEAERQVAALQVALEEQYQLALGDLQAGAYERAQGRLDNILQNDPEFPGAKEAREEALRMMNVTPTPLPTATAIPSPTPDLPRAEQLLLRAIQIYKDESAKDASVQSYKEMILTLLTLKTDIPDFRPTRVDGLMYVALRAQGIAKIRQLRLEEGMYFLALAEAYSPLDAKAQDRVLWARTILNAYQAAYRFRGKDWEASVESFEVVYANAPAYRSTLLHDYVEALVALGDQLVAANNFCGARARYETAVSLTPANEDAQQKLAKTIESCPELPTP